MILKLLALNVIELDVGNKDSAAFEFKAIGYALILEQAAVRIPMDHTLLTRVFITPHIITGEAPVEDHDLIEMMPADIMPKDLKKDIIDDRIKKDINLKSEKPIENYISKRASGGQAPAAETSGAEVTTKMKGIKKYEE